MAFSYIRYTGDGSTTQYTFNFTLGILSEDDVYVFVDDIAVPFTWVSDGIIDITTPPILGASVLIRRIVDKTALIHDYNNGAVIIEQNLDDSNLQSIMAVHEMLDGFLNVVQGDQTTLYELKTLTSGQTSVVFSYDLTTSSFYIRGDDVDSGRLLDVLDYTVNLNTRTVTLTQSYPAGTTLALVGLLLV